MLSAHDSSDTLPNHLIWLPSDREQQGLTTMADWLNKSLDKHSSSSFTASGLQQLGVRVVGAEDRSPGAQNFVWWPGVVRERALKMHSFRHGAEMLLAREDCRKVGSAFEAYVRLHGMPSASLYHSVEV
jgi:hypothetical protein